MSDLSLNDAVISFAKETCHFTDQNLELPWTWGSYDEEGVRFAFFRTYEELRQLAVELRADRHATGRPITQAQVILGGYQAAFQDLQALLVNISDQTAEIAPGEEWSQKRTLAHIIDAEQGFVYVIHQALARIRGEQSSDIDLSEEAWYAFWPFDPTSQVDGGHSMSALLSYYETLNARVLDEYYQVTDTELEVPSRYWEDTAMSIRFRLHRFDSHLRQHTIQIEKIQAVLEIRVSETRRLLRLIYNALAEVQSAVLGDPLTGAEARRQLASDIEARTSEITTIVARS